MAFTAVTYLPFQKWPFVKEHSFLSVSHVMAYSLLLGIAHTNQKYTTPFFKKELYTTLKTELVTKGWQTSTISKFPFILQELNFGWWWVLKQVCIQILVPTSAEGFFFVCCFFWCFGYFQFDSTFKILVDHTWNCLLTNQTLSPIKSVFFTQTSCSSPGSGVNV